MSTAAVGTGGPRIDGPNITGGGGILTSTGAAMPAATANPWVGGAAVAGAGILMGFNGF